MHRPVKFFSIPITLPVEDPSVSIGDPGLDYSGFEPFSNGPYASMYIGRSWTIRQYAGYSTAEESNHFYRQNLAAGQKGLSVAFDLPTHRGYDSDHPRVVGDVGKAGVAIDTVEDMKILFEGILLDKISVSMTMNGAVIPILAFFIVAAEEQGVSMNKLSGTIQNDILKEFLVRNTYIYPPAASMRLVTDIFEFVQLHMPKFNAISVSGYHMLEAGAPPELELAFTLADGYEYLLCGKKAKLEIDDFAPQFSFFFGIGMQFWEEIVKLRAARVLWARLATRAGAMQEKSRILRTHCQTSGWSLTQRDIDNNVSRTVVEAMAAIGGLTQSLHTNSMDEAIALPSVESAAISRTTQIYLQQMSGFDHWTDIVSGSQYVEKLTQEMIIKSQEIIDEVLEMGGMTKAIMTGYAKNKIESAAAVRQAKIDAGEEKIIGVNYLNQEDEVWPDTLQVSHSKVQNTQLKRLYDIKSKRNEKQVQQALKKVTRACKVSSQNILECVIQAARLRATLGEISKAIEDQFGRYRAPISGVKKIYGSNSMKNKYFNKAMTQVLAFEKKFGRRPRILVAKIGQDGHDRGAKIIASGFADIGFDVDIGPLFQTPAETARQAVENDVHLIGISTLAGAHLSLIPELIHQLNEYGREDILVIAGGIIPPRDHQALFDLGVIAIFGPGTNLAEAAFKILSLMV